HPPRCLAPREEAGIAGHLPDLPEYAFGRVENWEVDIGADIEDANFHRRVLVGIVEKGDDFLFFPRVQRPGVDLAAGRLDFLDERFKLGAVATPSENGKAFGSEFLGDLCADVVAGADHRCGPVSLLQGLSPALSGSYE